MQINTTSTGVFANPFLGVEAFLTAFSNKISRTCLSYAFTNRDFDNGVLGLAFVGTDSGQGGICSTYSSASMRTLNTGVVTITNFGQRVPQLVTILTFAHEAGHNFGSEVSNIMTILYLYIYIYNFFYFLFPYCPARPNRQCRV